MVTQIIIHLLPHEIDWFEWQSKQLKQGSYYLKKDDKVIISITLNLNLVNWENSQIPKKFFIDKFNQIKKYFDWCEVISEINENGTCLGLNYSRRNNIRNYTPDNFIYLDGDIIFKPETLSILIEGAKNVKEDYYIISPQLPKLWDSSWDVLVNSVYVNEPYGFEKIIEPYSILSKNYKEISLNPINRFKFGGGWFNLLSTKLLQLTDIPDSFGSYGIEDTYVMICCDIMKQKGYNVQQYIIENLVVVEDHKYRHNPYLEYLDTINRYVEFRQMAESNLNKEIQNFISKHG